VATPPPTRYAAFLSYSREADGELASTLQQALQRLAKPWNSLRALRVFRDDASMSANSGLWPAIRNAMDDAEFLVLLACPAAAASAWVDREVAHWLATKPAANLLICLTGGTIGWADGDFDREQTTSIPPALYGAFADEPRWVDVRALRSAELNLQVPAFRDRVADLAAPMHHTDKDQLFSEDARQLRRTRRLVRTTIVGLTALTLLATTGAVVAVQQRGVARHQRDTAVANQMSAEGQRLLAVDQTLGAQLTASAYRTNPSPSTLSRLVATTTIALSRQVIDAPPDSSRSRSSYSSRRGLLAVVVNRYAEGGNRVRLWDLHDPDRPVEVAPEVTADLDDVDTVGLSADGRRLAVARQRGIQLWDIAALDHPAKLGPQMEWPHLPEDVALNTDGTLLAARSARDLVQLWQVGDPAKTVTLGIVPASVSLDGPGALVFNRAGTLLAGSTQDGTTRLWPLANAFTRPPSAVVVGTRHAAPVDRDAGVAFSPDSTVLATGGTDSEVQLWNVADPAHPVSAGPPLVGHSGTVTHVEFADDGKTLVSAGSDRTVRLWDVSNPADPIALGPALTGHTAGVHLVAFAADRRLVSHASDGTVRRWRLPPARARVEGRITALEFGRDGTELVAGDNAGLTHTWSTTAGFDLSRATAQRTPPLAGVTSSAAALRLDHGALTLVDDVGHLRTWGPTGATTVTLEDAVLSSAAISPDGRTVAFGPLDSPDQLYLRTEGTAGPRGFGYPVPGQYDHVDAITFRSDGAVAAGSSDGTIRIWRTAGLDRPQAIGGTLTGHSGTVTDLAFTPDGHSLVSASFDNTIRVWALTAEGVGRAKATITGLDDATYTVAVAPDGSLFASAGAEGTIRLWDLATAAAAGPPIATQDAPVNQVSWNPRLAQLAVASPHSVGLIDLNPAHAIARICSATDWISRDEWRTRMSDLPYVDVCH
jgi:WD40 repeat protein